MADPFANPPEERPGVTPWFPKPDNYDPTKVNANPVFPVPPNPITSDSPATSQPAQNDLPIVPPTPVAETAAETAQPLDDGGALHIDHGDTEPAANDTLAAIPEPQATAGEVFSPTLPEPNIPASTPEPQAPQSPATPPENRDINNNQPL